MLHRPRHLQRGCAGLAGALLCWACSIGAPLVDHEDSAPRIGHSDCPLPPPCVPLPGVASIDGSASPVQLESCGTSLVCSAQPSEEALPSAFCAAMSGSELPPQAACTALTLHVPSDQAAISLQDSDWSDFNLAIVSVQPVRIQLLAPRWRTVFVQLIGPVVLHIEGSDQLRDVRIAGAETGHGQPRVELEDIQGQALQLGDAGHPFAGSLFVHASELALLSVQSRSLVLESDVLVRAAVRSSTLALTDVDLADTRIEADSAVLSAFSSMRSSMRYCADASLISGRLNETAIATCPDARLRLYSTSMSGGALDGTFELDASTLQAVRLGVLAATDIVSFESDASAVALCDQLARLALGSRARLHCSSCEPTLDVRSLVCALPDPPRELEDNFCSALTAQQPLLDCTGELPERTRPKL